MRSVITIISALIFSSSLYAASQLPGSAPTSVPPVNQTTPQKSAAPKKPASGPQTKAPIKEVKEATGKLYPYPGVVSLYNNKWNGLDNLLNVSKTIPIQIDFVLPKGESSGVSELNVLHAIANIFQKEGISTHTPYRGDKPPTPFFNVMILIYPLQGGYVASLQGRLFEEITVERIKLDPEETFQAITWEQNDLITASKDQFEKVVLKSVEDIATNFTKRLLVDERKVLPVTPP